MGGRGWEREREGMGESEWEREWMGERDNKERVVRGWSAHAREDSIQKQN
jgi:hypothetical protein